METQENFETWLNKGIVDEEVKILVEKADILIVPTEDFRDGSGLTFEQGTKDTYTFFKENLPEGLLVEIYANDTNYFELSLNSNYKRLGKFLVKDVALPIFISVLSSFVEKQITAEDENRITYTIINNTDKLTDNTEKKTAIPQASTEHKYPKPYVAPAKIKVAFVVVKKDGSSKEFKYEGTTKGLIIALEAFKNANTDEADSTGVR